MTTNRAHKRVAFTLIELLVAVAILVMLMAMVFGIFNVAHRVWTRGQVRAETFKGVRLALSLISRELECAIVATNTTSGKVIGFKGIQNASISDIDSSSTPPPGLAASGNDGIFFVAPAPSTIASANQDLTEYGYTVVYASGFGTGIEQGRYCLVRHLTQSTSASWNITATTNWWNDAGSLTNLVTEPFVDNVVGFNLTYEQNPPAGSPSATWTSTTTLPRAVHITICVLDSKSAIAFNAVCGGSTVCPGLNTLPVGPVGNTAAQSILDQNMRVFTRTVYLRNSGP